MSRRVREPFFSSLLRRIFALQNIPLVDSFPLILAAIEGAPGTYVCSREALELRQARRESSTQRSVERWT
jgi:hypothetical protein